MTKRYEDFMPSNTIRQVRALSGAQLDQFVQDGFVRLDNAFPRRLAEEGRVILWRDTGCDPVDRKTWTRPVVRLGYYGEEPFRKAVNTPVLHAAFDQLSLASARRPRLLSGALPTRRRSRRHRLARRPKLSRPVGRSKRAQ